MKMGYYLNGMGEDSSDVGSALDFNAAPQDSNPIRTSGPNQNASPAGSRPSGGVAATFDSVLTSLTKAVDTGVGIQQKLKNQNVQSRGLFRFGSGSANISPLLIVGAIVAVVVVVGFSAARKK